MLPIRDHNPSGRTPYVTYALVLANIGIFLSYWHLMAEPQQIGRLYYDWAMIPARVSAGDGLHGMLTSMFLHGGVLHLAGNMLFLLIFGDNMEDEMGHFGYLAFYLAAGLAAGFVHFASDPSSPIPTVGASGAIAGVMGGYLLLFPKARVDILLILIVFFRIFPIPAWIVLGVWFGMQIFDGLGDTDGTGGVAYWAHAGGFIAGIALTVPVWLRRGGPGFWRRTDGHPPHPEARYPLSASSVPQAGRRP